MRFKFRYVTPQTKLYFSSYAIFIKIEARGFQATTLLCTPLRLGDLFLGTIKIYKRKFSPLRDLNSRTKPRYFNLPLNFLEFFFRICHGEEILAMALPRDAVLKIFSPQSLVFPKFAHWEHKFCARCIYNAVTSHLFTQLHLSPKFDDYLRIRPCAEKKPFFAVLMQRFICIRYSFVGEERKKL